MGLMKRFFGNTRKPEGLLGRMMVGGMNKGHASVADWGIAFLPDIRPERIAELGCGGGRNVSVLLSKYPDSHLSALDYSEISVEATAKLNSAAMKSGRCSVTQGDVSSLPLESDSYDLATAFETVYFWPGPAKSFREVHRILKKGALFMIVNESDGTNEGDAKWENIIEGMKIYDENQLRGFLEEAGFESITVHHEASKHWMAIIARK